ncbi:MAG: 2-oxoacid:acceptor oxidoreductase family protein [Bacillota bacterium]
MADQMELRLSGTGGQGLILAGVILAEAAGVYEGKRVVQTQSYGPEAQGGASRADVIISADEILHTEVERPDVLLCLSQEACAKYAKDLKPGGTLIIDPLFVRDHSAAGGARVIAVEATRIATELGRKLVANVVALGALGGTTDVVDFATLKAAVLARAPKGTEELNRKALEAGYEAVGTKAAAAPAADSRR